jgi:DNA-binding HxlR family transcriptional regulator
MARINPVQIGNASRHNYLPGFSNRLFPVKPIVRVLGNLVEASGSQYIALDELQEKSAEVARELGKMIQKKDKTMGRQRGTIISAGLPFGREDKAKSRFENQFVGFIGKSKLEGAAPNLRFLEIIKDGNSALAGITDSGLKFAALPNPILDKQDYAFPFSEEEVAFLLEHIATNLEGERRLMRDILKSISDGVATPDEMTERVESWRRRYYDHQWTNNQVLAMRVGIISRMNELGLLERQKNGVKVTYRLTEAGKDYLKRLTEMGS